MFEAKILSGCWDEETIELTGMPKDFILSARPLFVLEAEEYKQLQAELEKHRWIPVSERLPEDLEEVIYIIRGGWEKGYYSATHKKWFNEATSFYQTGVTHWKPIILPEKGGE